MGISVTPEIAEVWGRGAVGLGASRGLGDSEGSQTSMGCSETSVRGPRGSRRSLGSWSEASGDLQDLGLSRGLWGISGGLGDLVDLGISQIWEIYVIWDDLDDLKDTKPPKTTNMKNTTKIAPKLRQIFDLNNFGKRHQHAPKTR